METLFDKLKKYSASGALPMHMPGHKRNTDAFPWLRGFAGIDITEIGGFDNLNDPSGIFAELERRMACLRGAGESICLVNGSTSGVLAAVTAVLEGGGTFLMARGSHKSVYNAAELVGADVSYLVPELDEKLGIWSSVTAQDVENALADHPEVKLVAVTSPTYEGVISDIRAIADVCHAHGTALFVDEAHGAHLGFGGFPDSAVSCGADLVVESLHKTLPCLTQTAVLHVGGDLVDARDVRRCAAMFQSSSPSYILSSSIDGCVDFMEREGDKAALRWHDALDGFYWAAKDFSNISILRGGFFDRDPSKIVISSPYHSGVEIMEYLRRRFNIELEMAAGKYAVAMTGMGDSEGSLGCLLDALRLADDEFGGTGRANRETDAVLCSFTLPEARMPARQAVTAKGRFYDIADAVGRISGEYVWAYPPGVPLLVPGEIVGFEIACVISAQKLHSTRGKLPEKIFCVGEY